MYTNIQVSIYIGVCMYACIFLCERIHIYILVVEISETKLDDFYH